MANVDPSNTRFLFTAGTFTFGGADVPIAVGSRVSCRWLGGGEWVVLDDTNPSQFYVMLDDRRDPKWKWTPRFLPTDPVVQRSKSFRMLDARGTGARSIVFRCATRWMCQAAIAGQRIGRLAVSRRALAPSGV